MKRLWQVVVLSRLLLLGAMACAAPGSALAGPVTFAQVSEGSAGNGVVWTDNGAGTATLNTATPGGDVVTFTYSNVAGLSAALSSPLSAVETINGGNGVATTAPASSVGGYDIQSINSTMTISYNLSKPIDGLTNLLTITITPNMPGAEGYTMIGQSGGSGASSTTSQPTLPASSYTMRFSSAFLNFAANSEISADFSYSSLDPTMLIGPDGLLDSFTAEDTATFSASPSPFVVREPASFGLLLAGATGLFAIRRKNAVGA